MNIIEKEPAPLLSGLWFGNGSPLAGLHQLRYSCFGFFPLAGIAALIA